MSSGAPAPQGSTNKAQFEVQQAEAGLRLDALLRRHLPELSRRLLAALFDQGRVRHDGSRAKKGAAAVPGKLVEVSLPPADQAHANPDIELNIVLLTANLVVVDKPAGQPCAPNSGEDRATLANGLVARFPEMASVGFGPREPGLVHRIDNDTSGLVLAARNLPTFHALRAALQSGALEKTYLAVAPTPDPASGCIESGLQPSPSNSRRVVVRAIKRGVRIASTHYETLKTQGELSLILLKASAAYRHQVRAHLASIHSPLVGDTLYGSTRPHCRHALHAHTLTWPGTADIAGFSVSSPLPEDLAALLPGA